MSPLVSTVPQGLAFGGHASKNRWCENGKLTLVKNKLKTGTVEGKVLNMWCSLWACWVNKHYSIPKQNTGKAFRKRTRPCCQEFAKSHFWQNLQRPVCSQWRFFPQLQILPKLSHSSFPKKTFWSAISISFLINGLLWNCLCYKSNSGKTDDCAHS